MTDEDWTELTTNDQKRAFIYGVGIKNRKIEKTNENMLTRFSEERFTISSPVYYLTFAAVFNNSFNDAQTTSASSAPSAGGGTGVGGGRSEEHTSELQSRGHIVCRLLLEK